MIVSHMTRRLPNPEDVDASAPALLLRSGSSGFPKHGTLGVVRSLGRLGVRTTLASPNSGGITGLSRYAAGWDRWEPRDLDDARAFEARSWLVETHVAASGFSYRKDGWISIGAWLRSVAGVDEGAFFSLDDIRPMLGVAGQPAVRATARLGGRSRR